ncbi:hypothetical protein [Candidatus Arthromitus sp. SFB-rat-Yit]|uniref:hypothetical protein n=1 Tax=Candidatus Arthromitus sp. SFB-rat-Yit TaxID=1041504 RepID=UPI0005C484EF|nr:hypothetical protein [Candidatus Arthromitus sp. SFB-rat-Yit]
MKKVLLGTALISYLTLPSYLSVNSMIKVPLDVNGDVSITIPLTNLPNKAVLNSYSQSSVNRILLLNNSKNSKKNKITIKND